MEKLRVGGLYKYQSKSFPTLGLWKHRRIWNKKLRRFYTTYDHSGEVRVGELFVVLAINALGEPMILTEKEKIGLIYCQHLKMKEMNAIQMKV